MRSGQSILEEYREADFEKRLNLFLECPSLRTEFIEIDQGEVVETNQRRVFCCGRISVCPSIWSRLNGLLVKDPVR
jgi:hypothetical protein